MSARQSLSQRIWDMKYRLKDAAGRPVDNSVEDSWKRVAKALAQAENPAQRAAWEKRFLEALSDFKVMPAGRILAGAGTEREVTLFNCFVMGRIPDDMGGIFGHLREAALTLQQGGGIGYDFSTLRPKGAPVAGVAADASGPLSFMDVWDSMCRTIMSAGARRGAMMGTLRCDHPDIEDFIDAKRDPARLRNFNLSVLVTDAFMQAVRADSNWDLVFEDRVFRSLPARALWERIMRATYDYAEPGVIFIDRINRLNNLAYCEEIRATNPCGEQPLPPYGACLLGSINLARLVERPFAADAVLDVKALDRLTRVAVRMLDNAIDISRFPLPAQAEEARAKRRIGLGVTGLADALAMVGLTYGSQAAVAATEQWMKILRRAAYLASSELAAEKGAFPLFEREAFLVGEGPKNLDPDIREAIAENGLRNGLLTSVAPTGTISLVADNVSSGLEPIFSLSYTRSVLLPDGRRESEVVEDYAVSLFRRLHGPEAPLPESIVDAQSLEPGAHLLMQAAVQRYIDASVSKTINLPEDIDFDAFKEVYRQAYDLGCKGCTTYRPNAVTGSVLAVNPAEARPSPPSAELPPPAAVPASAGLGSSTSISTGTGTEKSTKRGAGQAEPLARPQVLPGRTYKLAWPESDHAIYITLNDIVEEGRRRPFEIFINSKNMEHYAWTVALTRMISAVFRRGGDVSFVVEELKAVFDPRGGAWLGGRYKPSLLAAIGEVIETHMQEIGFLPQPEADAAVPAPRRSQQCPRCGAASLIHQEGCDLCTSCGWSRCG